MEAQASTRHWYVVQTEPSRERTAASHLISRRFECYLPIIYEKQQRGRVMQQRQVTMFPGYLFVHLDLGVDRYDRIYGLPGVRGGRNAFLTLTGDGFAVLRDEDFEWIRSQEIRALWKAGKEPLPFKAGQAVRVTEGPLWGFQGEIEKLDSADRITVLMDIFRRVTPVVLPAQSLEAIPAPEI